MTRLEKQRRKFAFLIERRKRLFKKITHTHNQDIEVWRQDIELFSRNLLLNHAGIFDENKGLFLTFKTFVSEFRPIETFVIKQDKEFFILKFRKDERVTVFLNITGNQDLIGRFSDVKKMHFSQY